MDFSDVYLKAEQRIMVRKADADSYKDIDSFNGKTIAVQRCFVMRSCPRKRGAIWRAAIICLVAVPVT